MIKNSKVLSLAEVKEKLEKQEETERIKQISDYLKKFSKIDYKEAIKLQEELRKLDIVKLRERHIVKIIDLVPEDAEDLHKIFVGEDVSLDQNEIEKILNVIKKYK